MKYAILTCALLLAACDNTESSTAERLEQSQPTLRSGSSETAPNFGEDTAPNPLLYLKGTDFDREISAAVLSKTDASAAHVSGDFRDASPSGTTGGVVFSLDSEIENAVSGKPIIVTVVSRGGPFAVAYSTADAGNSGWNNAPASGEWTPHTVYYTVPKLVSGNRDFIGIIPIDPDLAVEVKSVSIHLDK